MILKIFLITTFCYISSILISNTAKAAIIPKNVTLWKNCSDYNEEECTIKYKIDDGLTLLPELYRDIPKHIKEIETYANVKFLKVESGQFNLKISATPHENMFSNAPLGAHRKSSVVSNVYLNVKQLSGYTKSNQKGVFLHEMMHVMGFHHEHLHFERHMNFSEENTRLLCRGTEDFILKCQTSLNNTYNHGSSLYISDYDFESITHYNYRNHYVGEDGEIVKVDWGPDFYETVRTELSLQDKIALAENYPGKITIEEIKNQRQSGCYIDLVYEIKDCYSIFIKDDFIHELGNKCYPASYIEKLKAQMKTFKSCN